VTQADENRQQLGEGAGLGRRAFLQRSALTAAGVAVAGSGLSTVWNGLGALGAGAATPDYGTLDLQLSWVKNVEFAGSYIADTKGYYKKVGFTGVNLMSGGPTVQQDAVVQSGKAFACISAPDITSSAINNGADLKIVGAQYQKNPFCVMSLKKSPIKTPEDMIGKKIGVQATNEAVWAAFLKANSIDPSKIEKVPVQFDPTPLAQGTVDGWFSFFTNEPNTLKLKGVPNTYFLLADYKYPLVSEVYVVKSDTLKSDRDKLKAFLVAEIMGWQANLKNPVLGATLAAKKYGKDQKLSVKEQTLESKDENTVILTADTAANGLFTITDELLTENIDTLKLADIDITQDKLFDMSVIAEVYDENPELKTSPVNPTTPA
jgi:ABC-type nitrate/sulfonate/bicarbonate transport system substrate-binding protein